MISDRQIIKVGQRKRKVQQQVVQEQEESCYDIYDEQIEEIQDCFKRLSVSTTEEKEDLNKKQKSGEQNNFDLTLLPSSQKFFSKCEKEIQQNYDNEYAEDLYQTESTSDFIQDDVLNFHCNEINYIDDLNMKKNSVKSKKVQMKRNQKQTNKIHKGLKSRKIYKQKY